MKKIYMAPVCETVISNAQPLMLGSVHTGDSESGGTGGGRQGSNDAFFDEDDEDDEPVIIRKRKSVWDE